MHYLIYKITNTLNNKIYIGRHKTTKIDDGYMGSGELIRAAVEKYGEEKFTKEILTDCNSEKEMDQMEADLVDEEFVSRIDTYNIQLGGQGGWTNETLPEKLRTFLVERGKTLSSDYSKKYRENENFRNEMKEKISNGLKFYYSENKSKSIGKKHSEESKKRMSISARGKHSGKNHGHFGTHWVTNGVESKMVDKSIIPDGWRKGRAYGHVAKLDSTQ